jgi:hypothetical protein
VRGMLTSACARVAYVGDAITGLVGAEACRGRRCHEHSSALPLLGGHGGGEETVGLIPRVFPLVMQTTALLHQKPTLLIDRRGVFRFKSGSDGTQKARCGGVVILAPACCRRMAACGDTFDYWPSFRSIRVALT